MLAKLACRSDPKRALDASADVVLEDAFPFASDTIYADVVVGSVEDMDIDENVTVNQAPCVDFSSVESSLTFPVPVEKGVPVGYTGQTLNPAGVIVDPVASSTEVFNVAPVGYMGCACQNP